MENSVNKEALILSGGGAYGAYEIGVMKALVAGACPSTSNEPLDPHIFTGTSVGAVNAAVMTSQPGTDLTTTIQYLESIWVNEIPGGPGRCGNGVYRFRADVLPYLEPGCILSHPWRPLVDLGGDGVFLARDWFRRGARFLVAESSLETRTLELFDLSSFILVEPFKELLRGIVNLDGIQRSERELKIATTNWTTGDLTLFGNEDMIGERGYLAILASTAIPGFFPPHYIDGDPYVDGGLVMNTPLMPAIAAGATVLHAIYLDPDVRNIPVLRLQNTLDTFDRAFTISFAIRTNEDIETVRWVNCGLDVIERAAAGALASEKDMRDFIRAAGQIEARMRQGASYKKLTVHRYRPREDLGGALGVLNFKGDFITCLIEKGFNDTRTHDCEECDCVLP